MQQIQSFRARLLQSAQFLRSPEMPFKVGADRWLGAPARWPPLLSGVCRPATLIDAEELQRSDPKAPREEEEEVWRENLLSKNSSRPVFKP